MCTKERKETTKRKRERYIKRRGKECLNHCVSWVSVYLKEREIERERERWRDERDRERQRQRVRDEGER